MSYRIEYDHLAIRVPRETLTDTQGHVPWDDLYFWVTLGGDNNLIAHNGKPARRWRCNGVGAHTEVMCQAIELSGACESGFLKPGDRDMKPEAYIAKIRKVLGQAISLEEASARCIVVIPRLPVKPETLGPYPKTRYDKLCLMKSPVLSKEWDEEFQLFSFSAYDPESLARFNEYRNLVSGARSWTLVHVRGPGEF